MPQTWDNAPRWANWLAMDADGRWHWFENEPTQQPFYWHAIGKSMYGWRDDVRSLWFTPDFWVSTKQQRVGQSTIAF